MLVTSGGMSEEQVLDLPLDKFWLYTDAEYRRLTRNRSMYVQDTAAAIGGVFGGKDGLKDYLKQLTKDN